MRSMLCAADGKAQDPPQLHQMVASDMRQCSVATGGALILTLSTLLVSYCTHSSLCAVHHQGRQLSISHPSNLLSRPVCTLSPVFITPALMAFYCLMGTGYKNRRGYKRLLATLVNVVEGLHMLRAVLCRSHQDQQIPSQLQSQSRPPQLQARVTTNLILWCTCTRTVMA